MPVPNAQPGESPAPGVTVESVEIREVIADRSVPRIQGLRYRPGPIPSRHTGNQPGAAVRPLAGRDEAHSASNEAFVPTRALT